MSPFRTVEAEQFWRYIAASLDGLVELATGLPEAVARWRPPGVEGANSILVLARHMLANAEVNLCHTLGGEPLHYDREGAFDEDTSQAEIAANWAVLRSRFEGVLRELPPERLDGLVPHHWRGDIPGREVLIIVARHAAEHLAHASLTRDLAAAGS